MSLINDALKRAKEKQDQQPPPPDTLRRSMELARHPAGPGLALPLILAVVLALAVIFLWRWFEKRGQPSEEKNAPLVVQKPAPPPVVASAPPVSPSPVVTTNAPNAATNVAELPAPKSSPPSFKLQSIFYSPRNPSVVINGKILFIGDRVGEARVTAIGQDSATIVTSAGQTNLLELP